MSDQPNEAAKPKGNAMRNGCLAVICLFVVLAVIGSLAGGDGKTSGSGTATTEAAKPDAVKATAREIANAYGANQLSAAKKYEGKSLEVSGTVQAIDESFGKPVLHLATANQFLPLRAEFGEDDTDTLAKISKGNKVVVKCDALLEVGGFLTLQDCNF